jgi:hypothetical protein
MSHYTHTPIKLCSFCSHNNLWIKKFNCFCNTARLLHYTTWFKYFKYTVNNKHQNTSLKLNYIVSKSQITIQNPPNTPASHNRIDIKRDFIQILTIHSSSTAFLYWIIWRYGNKVYKVINSKIARQHINLWEQINQQSPPFKTKHWTNRHSKLKWKIKRIQNQIIMYDNITNLRNSRINHPMKTEKKDGDFEIEINMKWRQRLNLRKKFEQVPNKAPNKAREESTEKKERVYQNQLAITTKE